MPPHIGGQKRKAPLQYIGGQCRPLILYISGKLLWEINLPLFREPRGTLVKKAWSKLLETD